MGDRYLGFAGSAPGRFLTRRLGLPQPVPLRGPLEGPVLSLTAGGAEVLPALPVPDVRHKAEDGVSYAGVVVDATAVASAEGLSEVYAALHPVVRSVADRGRVVVLGADPDPADHHRAAAQQALEGFIRSLGKEIGRGRTVQLLRLADGAGAAEAESTLRFLLSPRSAYVSGQVVRITAARRTVTGAGDQDGPRTALVTGAARGIGEAVATTLAAAGAHVVCLDVPSAADTLAEVARRIGGTPLTADITAPDAGERIAAAVPDGLDVLVHNAGITRDRRLVNMAADRWDSVIDVNLGSVLRTTDALLAAGALREDARIVATASISGIAGNTGQTNYAASKAGIIGFVRALAQAPAVTARGITVNAVAPGFIETGMTAAVPLTIREAGRRMNSLGQGGLPVDVAETVGWLAEPGSAAVTGQVVRVCGQSLLGA